MKRIKNLGLTVFIALAATAAIGVTTAAASEFDAEMYPATLTAPKAESTHELIFQGLTSKCSSPSLEAKLAGQSKVIEATAGDTTCGAGSFPMKMNGCKITYHPGAEKSAGLFEGMFDVGPVGCGPIQIGAAGNSCVVTISPKSGLQATYENVGSGTGRMVKVTAQTSKLNYTQVSGYSCEKGSFTGGTWNGSWNIQGSIGGKQQGIHLVSTGSELPTTGIAVNGTPPKFVAGGYPLVLTGEQNGTHTLGFQFGKASCAKAKFSSSILAATTQLAVGAEYSSCTLAGLAGSMKMNGCSYQLNVENAGPPYVGNAGIVCPAGKSIEISTNRCTITIGAQTTNAGGLALENGASSSLVVGLGLSGLKYHQQKGTASEGALCTTGDYSTGTYSGSNTFVGSYQ